MKSTLFILSRKLLARYFGCINLWLGSTALSIVAVAQPDSTVVQTEQKTEKKKKEKTKSTSKQRGCSCGKTPSK